MREKILLVDDDHLLLRLYEQRLASDQFDVITATNGEMCLRTLEELTPQAIVLDLVMPGLDGLTVLQRLKDHPDWHAIPVLVFSNRGAPEDIDAALALGADDYLIKTQSTPSDLVEKIQAVLGRHEADGEGRRFRVPLNRLAGTASEVLQLEKDMLCPKCGAPMLLDIVMAGAGAKDFTGSLVCPNGCA